MKKIIIGLGIMMWLAACADIFEGDFSGYPVKLLIPVDSTVTSDTTIRLSWERVETVSDYQLQVAQPRFDSLVRMVKDTVTSGDSFVLSALKKGERYQWRVRAIGSNFVTPYSDPRTFIIKE
jgi:hypothetical protein